VLESVNSSADPSKSGTLGDRVFTQLLEQIHSGALPTGAVVNESALAAQLGVSRGPVREAVRRLQGIQLVSREPYLKARVVALAPGDVLELFQMREALEGYACRLAAERISDAEIAVIAEELEARRSAALRGEAPPELAEVNDFHIRIVEASQNRRIIDALCSDVYHLIRIYRRQSGSVADRKATAYQEHWQILRALKSRDGALAESLMRSHIARATSQLENLLAANRGERASSAA
jgi:DNA-binding GntR family transcriptional regulator